MKIVFLGLSITSSWGNGHATNYRGLVGALARHKHEVLFLERDAPWYAQHRDFDAPFVRLYESAVDLRERFADDLRDADLVIHGSYVPDVGEWLAESVRGVLAFYDIDTPVTLERLEAGACEYLRPELIPHYDIYLSFTGGPTLERLERRYGAQRARPFYCLVDPALYQPLEVEHCWTLGYLGTYDRDRQETLNRLLLEPASLLGQERFVVAGPQYPAEIAWPTNVERIEHVTPGGHASFYASQRLTLNVTRREMAAVGWSPSVRLFEAAACGVPIISDWWPGLNEFFAPCEEILVARTPRDVLRIVKETPVEVLRDIGLRARTRVLERDTADHRAAELEAYVAECGEVQAA
ncbi:MAG: glycosyltransferase [Gaiellaceae bacterium]